MKNANLPCVVMSKKYKDKITKINIDNDEIRKPRKPRHLGSGFHKDGRKVRNNTRADQLRNELEEEEEEDDSADY